MRTLSLLDAIAPMRAFIARTTASMGARGRLFLSLFAALSCLVMATPGHALIEIDITRGNIQPMPIAITDFSGVPQGVEISRVVEADLKRSGLFSPISRASYIQKGLSSSSVPSFANWTVINAQALVTGTVTQESDGRLKAEFRLWDVFAGQQMTGQQFFTAPKNWRRVAHIISDAIYERLTGEKGYFDTRIVFVDESGPKDNRVKRLAIMDQDGANVRYLTDGRDLVLTPRFSPTKQEITYMALENGQPRAYLLNIESGQRSNVGQFPGMSFSSRFSPDGQFHRFEPAAGGGCQYLPDGFAVWQNHPIDQFGLH